VRTQVGTRSTLPRTTASGRRLPAYCAHFGKARFFPGDLSFTRTQGTSIERLFTESGELSGNSPWNRVASQEQTQYRMV